MDNKVLEKIKKLLALAGSSEPHEAALALERAQTLMREYRVTEAEVEVGAITEMELQSIATATRLKGWELRLMSGIADAFAISLLFRRGYPYAHYIFIGPTQEVELARYAATVLIRALQRDRARFTRTLNPVLSRLAKTGEVDTFCDGWVRAVLKKVSKLTRPAAQMELIIKHVESQTAPNKSPPPVQQRSGSYQAYQTGSEMGQDVSLNKPMNGNAAPTKALTNGGES